MTPQMLMLLPREYFSFNKDFQAKKGFLRSSADILNRRTKEVFEMAWRLNGYEVDRVEGILEDVVRTLDKEGFFKWPAHYFLPGDSAAIMMTALYEVDYELYEPVELLRKHFKIPHRTRSNNLFLNFALSADVQTVVDEIVVSQQDPTPYELCESKRSIWDRLSTWILTT